MGNDHIVRFWAKAAKDGSWHPVAYHSLDVAACMLEILRRKPGMARLLADILGVSVDDAVCLCVWMASLHDIGKFSARFQAKRPDIVLDITGESIDGQSGYAHADGSMAVWSRYGKEWLKFIDSDVDDSTLESTTILFSAVAGHHGAPVNDLSFASAQLSEVDADLQRFAFDCMEIMKPVIPRIKTGRARQASWLLAGVVVIADWIGSNKEWFPYDSKPLCMADYWRITHGRARKAVLAAGMGSIPHRHEIDLRALFPTIERPTPLQDALSKLNISRGPGLCIVEDLTGSGKTEAALLLAQRMIATGQADGLYVALPTAATSNGMYARIATSTDKDPAVYRKLFAADPCPSLVLAHNARILNDSYNSTIMYNGRDQAERYAGEEETGSAACSGWVADMARKALLADVGVGTIDQALLAVLPNKYQSIRLVGLARKVVILDEIHCYDEYMTQEICGLLRFLGMLRCPVIALSATLPQKIRQQLLDAYRNGAGWKDKASVKNNAYPLITCMQECGVNEIETGFRDGSGDAYPVRLESNQETVLTHLIAAAENGCACWIRNTVDDAREAVETLQAQAPHLNIMLFHSRYCASDRHAIETEVLRLFGKDSTQEDRHGRILVATQVVEQSLDLDFDAMVTDLCPIDVIIQRGGRLYRHERGQRCTEKLLMVHSHVPAENANATWFSAFLKGSSFVYRVHAQLWLTAKTLLDAGVIALNKTGEARRLIDSVYGDPVNPPATLVDRDAAYLVRLIEEGVKGRQSVLNLRTGYDKTAGQWDADIRTPTRLGDPERPVRLAIMAENGIIAWSNEGTDYQQWIRSTLNLPHRWMDEVDQPSQHHEEINRIRSKWPKHERDIPIIVAVRDNAADIVGTKKYEPVVVRYTNLFGAERVSVL